MKKIFLIILTLPLLSFASDTDPNLEFQPGGAVSTALGTTAKPACKMCTQKMLRGKQTGAPVGAPSQNTSNSGEVDTGI